MLVGLRRPGSHSIRVHFLQQIHNNRCDFVRQMVDRERRSRDVLAFFLWRVGRDRVGRTYLEKIIRFFVETLAVFFQ